MILTSMLSERASRYARGLGNTPAGEPDPPAGQASASGWTRLPNGTWFKPTGVSKGLPSKKGAPYTPPDSTYTSPSTGLTIHGFRHVSVTPEQNFDPMTGKPLEMSTGGYAIPSSMQEPSLPLGLVLVGSSPRAAGYAVQVAQIRPALQLPFLPPRTSGAPASTATTASPPTTKPSSSPFEMPSNFSPFISSGPPMVAIAVQPHLPQLPFLPPKSTRPSGGKPSGSLMPAQSHPWWSDHTPAWWGGSLRGVGAVPASRRPARISRALRYAAEIAARRRAR